MNHRALEGAFSAPVYQWPSKHVSLSPDGQPQHQPDLLILGAVPLLLPLGAGLTWSGMCSVLQCNRDMFQSQKSADTDS